MKDTDCRKCGAKMPPVPEHPGPFGRLGHVITRYVCKKCGHWNDLKRRKLNKLKVGEGE